MNSNHILELITEVYPTKSGSKTVKAIFKERGKTSRDILNLYIISYM
jgi:hypothetical protein